MTAEQIISAARQCVSYITVECNHVVAPEEATEGQKATPLFRGAAGAALAYPHLAWMCLKIEAFAFEGRLDKASRWLGFVQGFLWSRGVASIDSFEDDNR